MTVDERIEKLTERHEALAQSVELLSADVRQLGAEVRQLSVDVGQLSTVVHQQGQNIDKVLGAVADLVAVARMHDRRISDLEAGS